VRAHGVLGDVEARRNLVGAQVVVEQQQHLDLARAQRPRNLIGNRAVAAAALPNLIQQSAGDLARQRRLAMRDSAKELDDALGRLALEQVAGRAAADRQEEVLLGAGGCQDDDLALRRRLAQAGQGLEPVEARHREVEQHELRLQARCELDRLLAVGRLSHDGEIVLGEQRGERVTRDRVIVDDQDPHGSLIGRAASADKCFVRHDERDDYHAWLWGEVLLIGLLGAALALFVAYPSLRNVYSLPQVRLVLDTAVMLAAAIVAVLAGIRFSVDGRRLDLLLCGGFCAAAVSAFAFAIAPTLGGQPLHRTEAWAGIGGRLLAATLIAAAPFSKRRVSARGRALAEMLVAVPVVLALSWGVAFQAGSSLPALADRLEAQQPFLLVGALATQALLSLIAVIGFGLRFRARGNDLDRWLCLGATLALFAELHYVFTPLLSSRYVSQGDFLRLLSYSVLLVGVWRAIRFAEFGRAVAEERARVAREIHDGLAQYLFAVSTHASMLESGKDPEKTLARLKEAAAAAQQEARFAVLALSSAGGSAPFDAALRRYVDFLTADGELEVDLEIQGGIRLAPDEQIEVFRIVQEGLANARKHAHARRATVRIAERSGERFVTIIDDGAGFDEEEIAAGQGLRNMRARAASIGGGFRLISAPGRGTALEVVLRA
jgi:signal transduction histidine kinase